MSRSKDIGTLAERAVTRLAADSGYPYARRITLHGVDDEGDVQLDSKGQVIVEVKGGKAAETASDSQIAKWLDDTERERVNAGARLAFLVVKRAGKGEKNAGQWWAVCGTETIVAARSFSRTPTPANMGPIVRLLLGDMLGLVWHLYGEEEAA